MVGNLCIFFLSPLATSARWGKTKMYILFASYSLSSVLSQNFGVFLMSRVVSLVKKGSKYRYRRPSKVSVSLTYSSASTFFRSSFWGFRFFFNTDTSNNVSFCVLFLRFLKRTESKKKKMIPKWSAHFAKIAIMQKNGLKVREKENDGTTTRKKEKKKRAEKSRKFAEYFSLTRSHRNRHAEDPPRFLLRSLLR